LIREIVLAFILCHSSDRVVGDLWNLAGSFHISCCKSELESEQNELQRLVRHFDYSFSLCGLKSEFTTHKWVLA